jgi:hypothetical protein
LNFFVCKIIFFTSKYTKLIEWIVSYANKYDK